MGFAVGSTQSTRVESELNCVSDEETKGVGKVVCLSCPAVYEGTACDVCGDENWQGALAVHTRTRQYPRIVT